MNFSLARSQQNLVAMADAAPAPTGRERELFLEGLVAALSGYVPPEAFAGCLETAAGYPFHNQDWATVMEALREHRNLTISTISGATTSARDPSEDEADDIAQLCRQVAECHRVLRLMEGGAR